MRRRSLLAAGLAALALGPWKSGLAAEPPVIAAAANLHFAITELAGRFEAGTGHALRLVFGSSGNFARQIAQGAPFELFLSADESYVLDLARRGLTRDGGKLYAVGRIALFAPHGAPFEADAALDGLADALSRGDIDRFAIANPEHAPYGRAAEQVLRHRGLWEEMQPRLVLGENVAQAAQFAASGSTQGGIVPLSLVKVGSMQERGSHAVLPENWHEPLNQRMVLLPRAGIVAERFYAFLQTQAAADVFRSHGFASPPGSN
jgi:molybdate transport system substrate-binding protein